MDVLIVVSQPRSARVLVPLGAACTRRDIRWTCFFTNDGVTCLNDPIVQKVVSGAERAVACEASWSEYAGNMVCPVELGSQTNHSALAAQAARIVGL
ncbi:MAG: hypothetical protein OES09_04695 [Gammaproteobacteria bacterium]|nr:hypothetical protein [Gammaproteobacteria bacterium]